MISEKIQLLGKGMYADIPDELTLQAIPTASELDYVGSEDFDKTMIEKIFPVAIEEKCDFYNLLELDYRWICRCLRIVNYGPYCTANTLYCSACGKTSHGEYQVSLNTVNCIPFPDGFKNEMTISRDEFIEFDGDVTIKLPTIRSIMNAYKDKAFMLPNGDMNLEFARMCYMITSIGTRGSVSPIEARMIIQNSFSPADYILLRNAINSMTDYGLRAGGSAKCPKCGSLEAGFLAIADDRFFRPSVVNLKQWKADKRERQDDDGTGRKKKTV